MLKQIENLITNKTLLKEALTHTSKTKNNLQSNERLEFLGDRVLGVIIANYLYKKYPSELEGDLAKRHATIVSSKSLATIAYKIGLDKKLNYSKSEMTNTDYILADSIEALCGAVFINCGYEAAEKMTLKLFEEILNDMKEVPIDMKSKLQEVLQKKGYDLPEYTLIRKQGSDHNPIFFIEVQTALGNAEARGTTKKDAETEAAKSLLKKLRVI